MKLISLKIIYYKIYSTINHTQLSRIERILNRDGL
jgi:hypothetical protein